jgi:serine/threonine protein kinase
MPEKSVSRTALLIDISSYTDARLVRILMEPVAECDMRAFLSRGSLSSTDQTCIRQAFGCLCSAIIYLQQNQCRHKDIKPQNTLIKNSKVYIIDFGIARNGTENGRSTITGPVGPSSLDYAALEGVTDNLRSSASDMWSLGFVYLDMVVGNLLVL